MKKSTAIGLLMGSFSLTVIGLTMKVANTISGKKVSEAGANLIKSFEALRLTAYKALPTEQYYTIGYGHYGSDVKAGMQITKEQAENMFRNDLSKYEATVATATITKDLKQNQFDALVCFCYNVGQGNFLKSTLLRKVLANPNDTSIRSEFAKWNKSGGQVIAGLTRRRTAEANYYFA